MEERKKQTQKTEKPCEVLRTEQEALDGSSPRKKPLNNLKEYGATCKGI